MGSEKKPSEVIVTIGGKTFEQYQALTYRSPEDLEVAVTLERLRRERTMWFPAGAEEWVGSVCCAAAFDFGVQQSQAEACAEELSMLRVVLDAALEAGGGSGPLLVAMAARLGLETETYEPWRGRSACPSCRAYWEGGGCPHCHLGVVRLPPAPSDAPSAVSAVSAVDAGRVVQGPQGELWWCVGMERPDTGPAHFTFETANGDRAVIMALDAREALAVLQARLTNGTLVSLRERRPALRRR